MGTTDTDFEGFLSGVASRLRHDLKGGLITLKMGIESLDDEQVLKPLLLEKSQELVDLSDKLVLLLRMGKTEPRAVNPESLFRQAANQAENLFPPLKLEVKASQELEKWHLDVDTFIYALLEVAQNAHLAGADSLLVSLEEEASDAVVRLQDNGKGFPDEAELEQLLQLGHSRWERSGIGLAIVERCLAKHGGSLSLQRADSGSLVTLRFPREE